MKKNVGLTLVLSLIAALAVTGAISVAHAQAGGGTLTSDASGGAALVFRKPSNPASSRSGGGRLPGTPKARKAAVTQDQTIAKANAARSAPTPRYSEAEQQYKLATRQDPTDARGHEGLGNVYLDQGKYADAVTAYQQAIKVKPDHLPAYQPLGYALVRLNRYPEAIETLISSLKYAPNNPEIYNNLSYMYVHAGRFQEAVEASNQAITLLGSTGQAYQQGLQNKKEVLSHAYKNLGNAYDGLKQYNDAADALRRAVEIEPTNASAHFNLGLALYNGRRYADAIQSYKTVVKLRPELAVAHFNLGLAYVGANDKAGAREEVATLQRLHPAMAAELQKLIKR
jgi:tetratricopeptide (TPR) repeat protein